MKLIKRAALAGLLIAFLPEGLAAKASIEFPVAILQALDKVTARVSMLEVAIGETRRFGSLEVTARICLETPPTEPPDSVAFLEVREVQPGEVGEEEFKEDLFTGWMFASSPALSALEHPVYDVWVLDCGNAALFGVEEPVDAASAKE